MGESGKYGWAAITGLAFRDISRKVAKEYKTPRSFPVLRLAFSYAALRET